MQAIQSADGSALLIMKSLDDNLDDRDNESWIWTELNWTEYEDRLFARIPFESMACHPAIRLFLGPFFINPTNQAFAIAFT
jgi:hypothetical protein